MKKFNELSQLKMLRESVIRIEEEQSGPVVYGDTAGGGEYIAFESIWDYRVYVSGLDYEASGIAYGYGHNHAFFELVSNMQALTVVPGRLIEYLNTAVDLRHLDVVANLVDDINEYFFRPNDDLNEEEQSGLVVYKDMGGYVGFGEYIAFESNRDFRVYVSGLDYETDDIDFNTYDYFKLVRNIPAEIVVPSRLIKHLGTAVNLGHQEIIEDLTNDVNKYYFGLVNDLNEGDVIDFKPKAKSRAKPGTTAAEQNALRYGNKSPLGFAVMLAKKLLASSMPADSKYFIDQAHHFVMDPNNPDQLKVEIFRKYFKWSDATIEDVEDYQREEDDRFDDLQQWGADQGFGVDNKTLGDALSSLGVEEPTMPNAAELAHKKWDDKPDPGTK